VSRYNFVDFTNDSGLEQLTRAYEHDAGFDLRASQDVTVPYGGMAIVPTGVVLGMPPNLYCRIVGRSSSLIRRGLITHEGVIDSGFRGELFVIVWNFPKDRMNNPSRLSIGSSLSGRRNEFIRKGEAIAQILFHQTTGPTLVQVAEARHLQPSERGEAGFGSSGPKAKGGADETTD